MWPSIAALSVKVMSVAVILINKMDYEDKANFHRPIHTCMCLPALNSMCV